MTEAHGMPGFPGEQFVGRYRIQETVGRGGMGEVYRAHDTSLNRDVAIKVLPDAFRRDPERLARFKREAHVLASLNHPNIATIYGFEESDDASAIVMEFVEGPTLADELALRPLPFEDTLRVARQIALALEAAHDQGVVHRDLKPANVKLRPDGVVKVLDFGLAKALDRSGDGSTTATVTVGTTQPGFVVGTAAYMSPEQAKGRNVDKRSDVWAFGCVLYEMLTGARAFSGDDLAETLGAVLKSEPDWMRVPADTPSNVLRVMRACLRKDTGTRLPAIATARFELEEIVRGPAEAPSAGSAGTGSKTVWWQTVAAIGMIATLIAGVTAWRYAGRGDDNQSVAPVRFSVQMPEGVRLVSSAQYPVGITSDGRRVVFVGARGDRQQFFVRALDAIDATPIPNTEGAEGRVLLSPDGQWLALFNLQTGTLNKVRIDDGQSRRVSRVTVRPDRTGLRGQAWGSRGTIVYGLEPEPALMMVSDAGGEPRRVTSPAPGEIHGRPFFMPDGRRLLFDRVRANGSEIALLDVETGETRSLIAGKYIVNYTASHHLFYIDGGVLWSARFDPERLQLAEQPKPTAEDIFIGLPAGPGRFAVAANGTLVYVRNAGAADAAGVGSRVVLVDERGRESPLPNIPAGNYQLARVSRTGDRLVLASPLGTRSPGGGPMTDLFVYDVGRATLARVIQNAAYPMWTSDGERLLFFSDRDGQRGVYSQHADGSGEAERLVDSGEMIFAPYALLPGRRLLVSSARPGALGVSREQDILVAHLDSGKKEPLLQGQSDDAHGELSPDGHWIAYKSNRTGLPEIYAERFPELVDRTPISSGGGVGPVWSRDGTRLYYVSPDGVGLFEVAVTVRDRLTATPPRQIFKGRQLTGTWGARSFDVWPKGGFVVIRNDGGPSALNVIVVENWLENTTRAGR